jgi:hypothetical protein
MCQDLMVSDIMAIHQISTDGHQTDFDTCFVSCIPGCQARMGETLTRVRLAQADVVFFEFYV